MDTVFVADVHLGKAAAFRARSIPLPHGTTQAAFDRLDAVLDQTAAQHMVVLGDLWHDRLGKTDDIEERLGAWTRRHKSVRFTLVTGNHDLKSGDTPKSTGFISVDELCIGPFCGLHHPLPREGKYVLCGHIHPGVEMGSARASLVLPCFRFGTEVGILPAFGEFTGVASIDPLPEDRLCVVADDEIFLITGERLASRFASSG